ncbi:MAG: glutamyl-tRNA reductase [Kouleothrix sp.]|nr:glutamyl-tRNA reductase [Kouleothrix sp.]
MIGTHQRICPVAVREQLAFGPFDIQPALKALGAYADEGFIISTCNRVELGGLVPDGPGGPRELLRFLAERHSIPADELAAHLYTYSGADAARHLFRLAAGLDSMVLGEDQIQTQLKQALADAQAAGLAGQGIARLLQHALTVGKLVRTATGIARQHLSVVSVALDIAHAQLGTLAGRRVLVVGAGRMAELALKHLRGQHAELAIVNRSHARAATLAERYDAAALHFEQLEHALDAHDIVVSCTAAPEPVITAAMLARALGGRMARPAGLLLLDLAVPRDIEPQASALAGVRLWDVDGLQAICEANRASREAEVARAEALIELEVAKFQEWWAAQEVVPTIRALRERAESIRTAELQRTLTKLAHLSPQEHAAIGALSAAIVNKLLHQPIATLKNPEGGSQLAAVVQELFRLTG